MRNTLSIARRQFASYFNGPVAYIVICAYLLILGFVFWKFFFLYGRASVSQLVEWVPTIMIVAAPALTMGLLAEEKRTGTIELMLTMPVRDSEVIMGKFLGVVALYAVILLSTVPYPVSVSLLGNLDWGPVWSSYLGLFLHGSAFLAIGLLASSWTDNQIVAMFIALVLIFAFWVFDKVLMVMPQSLVNLLEYMSLGYHLRPLARGVIALKDLVFFISIIGVALMMAFRSLESRRWK